MAVKDSAGLVKNYAMVNISKYQIVAVGSSIQECEENYIRLINSNGMEVSKESTKEISGVIEKISEVIVEGNSHYFIKLAGVEQLFDVDILGNIKILSYGVGSNIVFEYNEGSSFNVVKNIK